MVLMSFVTKYSLVDIRVENANENYVNFGVFLTELLQLRELFDIRAWQKLSSRRGITAFR